MWLVTWNGSMKFSKPMAETRNRKAPWGTSVISKRPSRLLMPPFTKVESMESSTATLTYGRSSPFLASRKMPATVKVSPSRTFFFGLRGLLPIFGFHSRPGSPIGGRPGGLPPGGRPPGGWATHKIVESTKAVTNKAFNKKFLFISFKIWWRKNKKIYRFLSTFQMASLLFGLTIY